MLKVATETPKQDSKYVLSPKTKGHRTKVENPSLTLH